MTQQTRDTTITVQTVDDLDASATHPTLRRWFRAIGRGRPGAADRIVPDFLDGVGGATRREEIHDLLLRACRDLTGSARVELRPVGGPNRVLVSRACRRSAPEPGAGLNLPIRYRSEQLGTLVIVPRAGRAIAPSSIALLQTLCSIAAIGDRLLGREPMLRMAGPSQPDSEPRPRALLLPFLRQLILLSRRRREPLSVLAIGLDRPSSAVEPMMPGANLLAVDPVIASIVMTLRESDLIIQQDNRTLVAVLPNASIINAPLIAEGIVRSVSDEEFDPDSDRPPGLAIGIASLSEQCREADVLLDLALEALRRARLSSRGPIIVAEQGTFSPHPLSQPGESKAG